MYKFILRLFGLDKPVHPSEIGLNFDGTVPECKKKLSTLRNSKTQRKREFQNKMKERTSSSAYVYTSPKSHKDRLRSTYKSSNRTMRSDSYYDSSSSYDSDCSCSSISSCE